MIVYLQLVDSLPLQHNVGKAYRETSERMRKPFAEAVVPYTNLSAGFPDNCQYDPDVRGGTYLASSGGTLPPGRRYIGNSSIHRCRSRSISRIFA